MQSDVGSNVARGVKMHCYTGSRCIYSGNINEFAGPTAQYLFRGPNGVQGRSPVFFFRYPRCSNTSFLAVDLFLHCEFRYSNDKTVGKIITNIFSFLKEGRVIYVKIWGGRSPCPSNVVGPGVFTVLFNSRGTE